MQQYLKIQINAIQQTQNELFNEVAQLKKPHKNDAIFLKRLSKRREHIEKKSNKKTTTKKHTSKQPLQINTT